MKKELGNYMAKPHKTIAQHTKEVVEALDILQRLNYIPGEKIYTLAKKACEGHDLGKVNREFQIRVCSEQRKQFDDKIEIAHNILSPYFIDKEEYETLADYYKVIYAILFHHHYGNALEEIRDKKLLRESLLQEFAPYQIKSRVFSNIAGLMEEPDRETLWIKGLLHKCDYSASAEYPIEYKNDFLKQWLGEVLKSWKEKDAKAEWRPLQTFCMENTEENIIVKAQTGMGKTEGGLHWIGNQKGFFVLPLRTAINAIYNRVSKNLLPPEKLKERVGILHSGSLEYYMKHFEEESDVLLDYEQRGKNLSLPLSISTLDQLFDFVFKYPAYEMKLVTLAYSKIVIDEIQMYDPNLLAYLIHGIKMIYEMGGKIAIMTATFPPFMEKLLYPVPFKMAQFIDKQKRHHVKVLAKKMEAEDIYTQYLQNQKNGNSNKILVVCNTIKKAQKIYEELGKYKELKGMLHILHSRFIRKDRAGLEQEILEFGRTYEEDGNLHKASGIWVSTSLVEVSLDIDFDILFTELKDLGSLFQRFGRCNRKGIKDVTNPNCFVYTQIDEKDIRMGDKGFIDRQIYELSKEALEGVSGLLSEEEKMNLMDQFFTFDRLKDSDYIRAYDRKKNYLEALRVYETKKEDIDLREILAEDVLPNGIYEEYREIISGYVKEFSKNSTSKIKKKELLDKINEYMVSVPSYMVHNYERAKGKGTAYPYHEVKLSDYRNIKVIECSYDEMGVREINFKNVVRMPNMVD